MKVEEAKLLLRYNDYFTELINLVGSLDVANVNKYIAYEVVYAQELIKQYFDDSREISDSRVLNFIHHGMSSARKFTFPFLHYCTYEVLREFSSRMDVDREAEVTPTVRKLWKLRNAPQLGDYEGANINNVEIESEHLVGVFIQVAPVLAVVVGFLCFGKMLLCFGIISVLFPILYLLFSEYGNKSFIKIWDRSFTIYPISHKMSFADDYLRFMAQSELKGDNKPRKVSKRAGLGYVFCLLAVGSAMYALLLIVITIVTILIEADQMLLWREFLTYCGLTSLVGVWSSFKYLR